MSEKLILQPEITVAGVGSGQSEIQKPRSMGAVCNVELDVTAAGVGGTDTLDVYLQTKIGNAWVDVIHFTQIIGTVPSARYWNKLIADQEESEVDTSAALAVKTKRHIVGDEFRVRWDVAGATSSFTFSVSMISEAR